MLNLGSAALKVFLALDPCDMRKSFNGLSELASRHHDSNPGRDSLFVFTNKNRNRIKLLYFDGTGTWVAANHWDKIIFCLTQGVLEIDTNGVENMIRPTKLGMKNWMRKRLKNRFRRDPVNGVDFRTLTTVRPASQHPARSRTSPAKSRLST